MSLPRHVPDWLAHSPGSVWLLVASIAAGCGPGDRVHELPFSGDLKPAGYVESDSFGGVFSGFAEWLSSNGRIAVVYRFSEDTDGDDTIQVSFGIHGWPMDDHPVVVVADLVDGWSRVYDEFLTADPRERYIVVREDERLWLIDSADGSRRDLTAEGAVAESDGNLCMPPRQVSFDWRGERLAFLRAFPSRAVIQDLATGEESEVVGGEGLLWRAELRGAPGWIRLQGVERDTDGDGQIDFPIQRGSCACDWCRRFALSFSFGGWIGDSVTTTLVTPAGQRIREERSALPLSDDVYAVMYPGNYPHQLFRADGSTIPLPEGCHYVEPTVAIGVLLLSCGDRSRLFWPDGRRDIELPVHVSPIWTRTVGRSSDGKQWLAVLIPAPDVEAEKTRRSRIARDARLARLRLEDGRIEAGPVVDSLRVSRALYWVVAASDSQVVALNYGTGELWRLRVGRVRWLRGLGAGLNDDRGVVLAPDHGVYFETSSAPVATSAGGCVLRPSSTPAHLPRGLESGPWRRRCVAIGPTGEPQPPRERR